MRRLLIAAVACCLMLAAQANVVILGTRVIYPADEQEVTIKLTNPDQAPALVQTWIDDGNPDARGEDPSIPFVLTPPLFRMEADVQQVLRLVHTGEQMAKDRETLFYFNLLDIPPKPSADSEVKNYLQFAIRSRLKLFYRPSGLQPVRSEAEKAVRWLWSGGKLVADNQTPYYLTFVETKVGGSVLKDAVMIAPFSQAEMPLQPQPASKPNSVHYGAMNDYGGVSSGDATIN